MVDTAGGGIVVEVVVVVDVALEVVVDVELDAVTGDVVVGAAVVVGVTASSPEHAASSSTPTAAARSKPSRRRELRSCRVRTPPWPRSRAPVSFTSLSLYGSIPGRLSGPCQKFLREPGGESLGASVHAVMSLR
jgi:hypothetical protein